MEDLKKVVKEDFDDDQDFEDEEFEEQWGIEFPGNDMWLCDSEAAARAYFDNYDISELNGDKDTIILFKTTNMGDTEVVDSKSINESVKESLKEDLDIDNIFAMDFPEATAPTGALTEADLTTEWLDAYNKIDAATAPRERKPLNEGK